MKQKVTFGMGTPLLNIPGWSTRAKTVFRNGNLNTVFDVYRKYQLQNGLQSVRACGTRTVLEIEGVFSRNRLPSLSSFKWSYGHDLNLSDMALKALLRGKIDPRTNLYATNLIRELDKLLKVYLLKQVVWALKLFK